MSPDQTADGTPAVGTLTVNPQGFPLWLLVLLILLWPLLVLAWYHWSIRESHDQLLYNVIAEGFAMRAPVVVVDIPQMATLLGRGPDANTRIADGLRRTDEIIAQLAEHGFLVVERRAVLAHPPTVEWTTQYATPPHKR